VPALARFVDPLVQGTIFHRFVPDELRDVHAETDCTADTVYRAPSSRRTCV
jgi:hypothetical protein